MLNWSRYTIAADPASAPAIANVIEIVRLTLMPIIAEASVSWATARIAFPCFVERTNQVSRISTGIVITSAASLFQEYVTLPIPIASERGMNDGTERKLTSKIASEMFWTMNDMPTAV